IQRARRVRAETERPSVIARVAASTAATPSVTTGLRMALEPGRGTAAVPVRSAFTGAVLGTAGVVAVLIFSLSLQHLVDSPRLYGWSFDAQIVRHEDAPPDRVCDLGGTSVTHDDRFSAVATLCLFEVAVDGRPTAGYGYRPRRGSIDPTVVAGHAPRTSHEVALGATTIDSLGKRIGDSIDVRGQGRPTRFRIVGTAAFPSPAGSDAQALADGAAFTGSGAARLITSNNQLSA